MSNPQKQPNKLPLPVQLDARTREIIDNQASKWCTSKSSAVCRMVREHHDNGLATGNDLSTALHDLEKVIYRSMNMISPSIRPQALDARAKLLSAIAEIEKIFAPEGLKPLQPTAVGATIEN